MGLVIKKETRSIRIAGSRVRHGIMHVGEDIPQAPPDILVSGFRCLSETQEVCGVIPAASAEL